METPETIRTSLQQGECVTSVDQDAYFHIPIQEQWRKYLRLHVQGQMYHFKALPFGLSTAPMEFTVLAKEVKLIAIHKGIRIHQYIDDWLVRARSHHICLQRTQILVKICQDLGWLVNVEKSELEPKQVFDFVGYQFDLMSGRVRPTPDRWQEGPGLSTAPMEFTVLAKEVKLIAIHKGIRIHQYIDDWLVRARSHHICLQRTQILVKICQDLGWLVNVEKSELEPKQVFDFVGYQFDLMSGRVRPTPDRWQSLQEKIQALLLLPACPVRQFMSLIGLLTATEKQVQLGRLHMRPIQWHLKSNWRVPESLEKVIPIPRSLHPHLQWWLEESNVLQGQPLHPVKHALQILIDASKRRVGRSLRRTHGKRVRVNTRKQAAYKLSGTKSSLSSFKSVPRPLFRQDSSGGNRQYNCRVIHKQGRRHEVGPTGCPTVENLGVPRNK